jgi:serine/threonine-protein kinase
LLFERCQQCRSLALVTQEECPIFGGTPCVDGDGRTLIQRELDGRYTLLEVLATGGMGAVFRATQTTTGRDVAVKMLPASAAREDAVLRLATEAKALGRLNDPHTVAIIDFGRTPTGLAYLVMELLLGTTLRALVAAEGPVAPARALRLRRQVLDALESAHGVGVVHRDIKPENLILLAGYKHRDFVKVLDFGIARLREADASSSLPPLYVGTPTCMAPEQVTGDEVDGRTDLYALGGVLFFLMTGRYPFEADDPEDVMRMKAEGPAPRLGDVAPSLSTPELERLFAALLARRAADRPADAAAARALVDGALRRPSLLAASTPPPAVRRTPTPAIGPHGDRAVSILDEARERCLRAREAHAAPLAPATSAAVLAIRRALVEDAAALDAWLRDAADRARRGEEGWLDEVPLPNRRLGAVVLEYGDDRRRARTLSIELRGLLEGARAHQTEAVDALGALERELQPGAALDLVLALLDEERSYLFEIDAAREYLQRSDESLLRGSTARDAIPPPSAGDLRPPPTEAAPPAPTLVSSNGPRSPKPPPARSSPPVARTERTPRRSPKRADSGGDLAPVDALERTREQHRRLHALATRLDADSPDGRATVEALVEQLWSLATRHFADEEALMAATSMPTFREHRRQHDELREQLALLRGTLGAGAPLTRIRDMVSVLVIEWLGVHIATTDSELERYVRTLPLA